MADADRLAEPFLFQRCRNAPSRREGEKFFEHFAGAGRIKGGTAMTTYYESGTFGGALTIGPADEFVNLHGSGVMIDIFGTAISSTLTDGFETVESGGLDSGSTLDVELTVMSGGTVIDAAIQGRLSVMSGGTVTGSTMDGLLNVSSGGTVIGLTVTPGNWLNNYTLAGEAIGVTLDSGTNETISSGGVAIGTTVSNSTVVVSSGGIDSGATLYGRSVETVASGGEAIDATVLSGATLALAGGAIVSGYTIASGGTLRLLNYTLSGFTVSNGVVLDDMGTVFDTIVESGGTLSIENWGGGAALASGVVVESGGTISMGGGTVSGLTVESGGVDIVNFGTTVGTTVLGGANEYVLGGAVRGTNISSGGVETIEAGYSFNTTVSGGAVEILSGVYGVSSASDTAVLSGGELIVTTLGISLDADVAGTEILQGGGEDYDSTIESGGLHVVQGRSYDAVLSAGGEEIVSSGGRSIFTTVSSGGIEIVSSGGAATDLIVSSGGIAVVSSGGSEDLTVLAGGYELIASGGFMSGATISAGTLELASGASVLIPSVVEFSGGGTLLLDASANFHGLVAGFGSSDQIDLRDVAFVSATKKGSTTVLSLTEPVNTMSGTLTVTDGVHAASIQLLGQYTASEFTAASDGHGGTLITFTSATSTTGGHGHGNAIASPVTS